MVQTGDMPRTTLIRRPWFGISVAIGFSAALTLGRMVFANDDFPQFAAARSYGLSWRLLSLNVFQHFAPINRFAHWLALTLAPLDTRAGQLLALTFLTLFVVSFSALLGALGTPAVRRTVLVILMGTAAPLIDTMSWFDGAMQWLPYLTALALFLYCHVRFIAHPAVLPAFAAFGAFGLSIFSDIRFVLTVPLAFLLDICVIQTGGFADRLRALQARVPYYAMLTAALLAAALVTKKAYGSSHLFPGSEGLTASITWHALTTYLPSRLVGLDQGRFWPFQVEITVAVFVFVVLGILIRVDRRNIGPIVFAIFGLIAPYLLLYYSDLLVAGVEFSARRSDYMLPGVMCILVAASRIRMVTFTVERRWWPATIVTSIVVMIIILVPPVLWRSHDTTYSRLLVSGTSQYFDNLRQWRAQWSNPTHTLIGLTLPENLGTQRDLGHGDQRYILRIIDPHYHDVPLTDHPFLIDNHGRPQPARLLPVTDQKDIAGCSGKTSSLVVNLGTLVSGSPLHVRLWVVAKRAVTLRVLPLRKGQVSGHSRLVDLTQGVHRWVVLIDAPSADGLLVSTADHSRLPCMLSAQIVRVTLVEDRGDCRMVGHDGSPGPTVPCTTSVPALARTAHSAPVR
jgi:hypothetical protein